jgi:hypothetical protein
MSTSDDVTISSVSPTSVNARSASMCSDSRGPSSTGTSADVSISTTSTAQCEHRHCFRARSNSRSATSLKSAASFRSKTEHRKPFTVLTMPE